MRSAVIISEPVSRRRVWLALAPALALPTLSALFYFVVFQDAAIAKPIYLATKCFTVFWPVIATIWILHGSLGFGAGAAAAHRRSFLPGLLVGLVILAVMVAWMRSPWSAMILAGGAAVRAKVESLGFLDQFFAFAIFITIVHSFIEEFYWRWFVFGNLRRVVPLAVAHGIAALGFAAHHLVVTCQYFPFWFALGLAACVALGGLIWTCLFQRYNSLLGCWISHACVDSGLMWVGYQMIFSKS